MYELPYSEYVITKLNFEILKGVLPPKFSHVMFVTKFGETFKNGRSNIFKIESEVGNNEPDTMNENKLK